MKKGFWIFLLLCMNTCVFGQYEVSVTTIPVWVKVEDKSGNPVLGLTVNDFELSEDGKKVQINCFEEVNLDESAPKPAENNPESRAPAEPQRFVLFLDLYNTSPREFAAVKPALQEFLESLSHKNVEVMLAALMPDRRLGIISRFTKDLKRVKILIDFAKANPNRDASERSKTKEMTDVLKGPDIKQERRGAAGVAVAGVTQEDSTIDGYQTARILASQDVETSRYTLRALETFAEHLSRIDLKNHASMILVSGGFSVDPGKRFFNMAEAFQDKAGDTTSHDKAQYRQTGFYFRDEVDQSIGKLNRLNVTLYTLDTRGVVTEEEYQDSLIQIAQETGGLAFFNSNSFTTGLDRVQEDLKHQYLLCYSPPEHKALGKYHTIRVNVKRSGVSVRYRDGYWD